ncbi:hypothetical protein [Streptomyces sp. NPDC058457]
MNAGVGDPAAVDGPRPRRSVVQAAHLAADGDRLQLGRDSVVFHALLHP